MKSGAEELGTWKNVYFYRAQPSDHRVAGIIILLIMIVLLSVILVMLISSVLRIPKRRNIRTLNYTILSLVFLSYCIISIYREYNYQQEERQIQSDLETGKCRVFAGKITKIYPETGDGYMAFEISGRVFRYNGHSIALSDQLCSADGPPLCVGDIASICVHNDSDGEILRMDKLDQRN